MRLTSSIFRVARFALPLLVLGGFAAAQTPGLTGAWRDDGGSIHCVRQVGNDLFWYVDDRPNVHNVFYGMIAGGTVTGKWADLPGGRMQGSGLLSLRIESNARWTKIDQSGSYGASVWTRADDAGCRRTVACPDLSGTWYDYTTKTGARGKESRILQAGCSLTFVNEFGDRSAGGFLNQNRTVVASDWEGGLQGDLADGAREIRWRNGSVWRRTRD